MEAGVNGLIQILWFIANTLQGCWGARAGRLLATSRQLGAGPHRDVLPPPPPPKGRDATSGQSVEGPEVEDQPSMATTAREEDTRPKVHPWRVAQGAG